MADFGTAFRMILDNEGDGAAPDDPGGRTKWGISERSFPEAWRDGPPTKEDAKAVYLRSFWDPLSCGKFSDSLLALELFDFAVNSGVHTAAKVLQQAYNELFSGEVEPLAVDGVIGPKTLRAVNRLTGTIQDAMYNLFVANRIGWYKSTARVRNNGWKDRRGWLARCNNALRWGTHG